MFLVCSLFWCPLLGIVSPEQLCYLLEMVAQLDSLKEANRLVLARIAEREEELTARSHALEDELSAIENERRSLASDRETIQRAEAIQAKVLGSLRPPADGGETARNEGGQTRARIGAKRYAMLVALREKGSLSVEEIAEHTGLNVHRVKEQMRADHPQYVNIDLGAFSKGQNKLLLTGAGHNLIKRFEGYRRAQDKPLPPLKYATDQGEDDEVVAEADEAEA